jgi:hypothetical protein
MVNCCGCKQTAAMAEAITLVDAACVVESQAFIALAACAGCSKCHSLSPHQQPEVEGSVMRPTEVHVAEELVLYVTHHLKISRLLASAMHGMVIFSGNLHTTGLTESFFMSPHEFPPPS